MSIWKRGSRPTLESDKEARAWGLYALLALGAGCVYGLAAIVAGAVFGG